MFGIPSPPTFSPLDPSGAIVNFVRGVRAASLAGAVGMFGLGR